MMTKLSFMFYMFQISNNFDTRIFFKYSLSLFLFLSLPPSHFSLTCAVISHIESLKLFYDWRRLNDITWFRKCWYHTGLVEALFIGRKTKEDVPPPHPPSPYDPHQLPYWSPSTSGEESTGNTYLLLNFGHMT